jgi:hypothetical protein
MKVEAKPQAPPKAATKSIKDQAAEMATTSVATARYINGPNREQLSVKLLRDEDSTKRG